MYQLQTTTSGFCSWEPATRRNSSLPPITSRTPASTSVACTSGARPSRRGATGGPQILHSSIRRGWSAASGSTCRMTWTYSSRTAPRWRASRRGPTQMTIALWYHIFTLVWFSLTYVSLVSSYFEIKKPSILYLVFHILYIYLFLSFILGRRCTNRGSSSPKWSCLILYIV